MVTQIAIIGAGQAGLVTAKYLLSHSKVLPSDKASTGCNVRPIQLVIFEKSKDIGGMWSDPTFSAVSNVNSMERDGAEEVDNDENRMRDHGAEIDKAMTRFDSMKQIIDVCGSKLSSWEKLKTNISKYSCCFSDFPWPKGSPLHPSQAEMSRYFRNYADHFGLNQYIQFNREVLYIGRDNGSFVVRWKETGKSGVETANFDIVIISTGFFARSMTPNISTLSNFRGNMLHSRDYTNSDIFQHERHIVVVGASHSSCEISAELAAAGKQVTNILPRDIIVLPRFIPSGTSDSLPMLPLDVVFYNLSKDHLNILSAKEIEECKVWNGIEKTSKTPIERRLAHKYLQGFIGDQTNYHNDANINEEVKNNEPYPFVAISDSYHDLVASGMIRVVKGYLTNVTADGDLIVTNPDDGPRIDPGLYCDSPKDFPIISEDPITGVDGIVFCTGYAPNLEFLDQEILKILEYDPSDLFMPLILDKDIMHPDISNLYFVGMHRGPFMGVVELQACLIAKYVKDFNKSIADTKDNEGLKASRAIRNLSPRPQFPHGDTAGLMLDLAHACGCLPKESDFPEYSRMIAPFRMITDARNNKISESDMLGELNDYKNNLSESRCASCMASIVINRLQGVWCVNGDKLHRLIFRPLDRGRSDQYVVSTGMQMEALESVRSLLGHIIDAIFIYVSDDEYIRISKDNTLVESMMITSRETDVWVGRYLDRSDVRWLFQFRGAYLSSIIIESVSQDKTISSMTLTRPSSIN